MNNAQQRTDLDTLRDAIALIRNAPEAIFLDEDVILAELRAMMNKETTSHE